MKKKPLRILKKKALPVKKTAVKKLKPKTTKMGATKKAKPVAKKLVTVKRKSKKVLSIPKGFHTITPYLILDDASRAIEFYKAAFGAKEKGRMESPDGQIAHAELQIGDSKMMLSDVCPNQQSRSPLDLGGSPVGIHLYVKKVDEVFNRAVKAGAKVLRPVENMFYGDRAGEVEDPFGYRWHISTHVEDVSLSQVKKRMAKFASDPLSENNKK